MCGKIKTKMGKLKEKEKIDMIIKKLEEIENCLKKFVRLIPEESLKEYENFEEIKKAYLSAVKKHPPTQ